MPPVINVVIVDPAGYRWMQAIDVQVVVEQLAPAIARNVGLPDKVRYDLVRQNGQVLASGQSPAQQRVLPNEPLWLRPVRDSLFARFMRELYDQAKEKAQDELWEAVEDQLQALYRLEPAYPDTLNLRGRYAKARGSLGRIPPAQAQPVSAPAFPPIQAGPMYGSPYPPPAAPPPAGYGSPYPPQAYYRPAPPRKGPGLGCVLFSLLGGTVALGAVGVVGVGALLAALSSSSSPTGGGGEPRLGTGDVQVTLRWDSAADLDLHVIDPGQETINFLQPASSSGGQLDVDAHRFCQTNYPVENIYWPDGGAPRGAYVVYVDNYEDCGAGASSYTVTITIDGVSSQYTGTAEPGTGPQSVSEFSYP